MDQAKAEDLVRRIATAVRGADLYSPTHPLVQRGIDNLVAATQQALQSAHSIIVGFIDDEIVVDGIAAAARHGGAGRLRARSARARHREDYAQPRPHARGDHAASSPSSATGKSKVPLPDQLAARGVRNIALGRVVIEEVTDEQAGIAAAKRDLRDGGRRRPKRCGSRRRPANSPTLARRGRSSTASRGW